MSQPLPIGEFGWLSNDEINSLDLHSIRPDSKQGYILEVDLEYPKELHDSHDAFPLAPESLIVPKEWMSPYELELLGKCSADKVPKLIPHLGKKK